jgi:RNA polymerase sigma factor (sigma-70 family)
MIRGNDETSASLRKWYEGDRGALDELIERHLPWIQAHVRRRLGPVLRSRGDTVDYVQDAMIQFLQFGPRFTVTREEDFRALVARIVENSLRNKYDWFTARRRDIARERPLPSDTVLSLDPLRGSARTPSMSAERREREAWIRLGMELLDADAREILILRQWDRMSYAQIGERLGTTPDAARMRHNQAVRRLASKVQTLRTGRLAEALAEEGSAEA